MNDQVVLITGGAGFLGEHLARSFLACGMRVRIFDRAATPGWASQPRLETVQGDVRDLNALKRASLDVAAIVHAAFASPRQTPTVIREVNVDGTRCVCTAARVQGVRRLVLVSSTVVTWAPRPHPFLANSPLSRLDLYRQTRTEAERIATDSSTHGPSVAIVRPQSFLGPGRLGAFGIIFELIKRGEPVPVLAGSDHRYQLLGVQDLAEAIRLLVSSDAEGVFSFGAREFGTVREDLEALLAHARSGSVLRRVPGVLARPALRAIELAGMTPLSEWHRHSAWQRDSIADSRRAEQELGWRPHRSNVDALIEAYDWYVQTAGATGEAPRTHPLPRAHKILRKVLWMLPAP